MSTRVYVPLTSSGLADLVDSGTITGPVLAHAVTDDLRDGWADGDDEQWEYAALQVAGDHSAQLRGAADLPRRYVVAADVRRVEPVAGDDPTLVVVPDDLAWSQVASAHVDTEDDARAGDDLAWFARQEIPGLLTR